MKVHPISFSWAAKQLVMPIVAAMASSALLSGCQWKQCLDDQFVYCEPLDDAWSTCTGKLQAHRAWKQYSHHCADGDPHKSHYMHGFMDGFYDVARGGNGCLPAIPPRKYWNSCYETAEGRLKICAYFQGYSRGVQAAYEMGAARSARLPASSMGYQSTCPTCPNYVVTESEDFLSEPVDPNSADVPAVPPAPINMNEGNGAGLFLPNAPVQEDRLLFPLPAANEP